MKNIQRIVFALTLLTLLGIVSCEKSHCYHCYSFLGYFKAFKNGDTVYSAVFSTTLLHDSINYYTDLGYTIDTVHAFVIQDPRPGAVVCDTNSVYLGQPVRDSCAIII